MMGNRARRVCAEEGIGLREGLFHNPGERGQCLPTWVLGCWVGGAGGQGWWEGNRLRDFESRPQVQLKVWRRKRIVDALFFKQLS